MTIRKIVDVYFGDSIRTENGSESGMPIFGRFASIVRCGRVQIVESDDGQWTVLLPFGSSLVGDWTEADAESEAIAWAASGRGGWTTEREPARRDAIASAKARHEAAMGRETYRAKYGAAC